MSFQIEGVLHKKEQEKVKSNTFSSRYFVLKQEKNDRYNDLIPFQLINERTSLIDNIEEGALIRVHFNLRGTEKKEIKNEISRDYWLNLDCWKIDKLK